METKVKVVGTTKVSNALKSNVVEKNKLREIQLKTILTTAEYLIHSAGPNGSNTAIMKEIGTGDASTPANTIYTKDGKTILSNIKFLDSIENSIVDELVNIAAHLVSVVGDGTTSVIVLASIIFNAFVEKEDELKKKPFQIIRDFKEVSEQVKSIIASKAKEVTINDIYKIAMISTNGNKEISEMIMNVYKKYGMSTHISLGYSNNENTIVKVYNGLTLPMGYLDGVFVNEPKTNTCIIDKAEIYAFRDPVVSRFLMGYFEQIIHRNIIEPITSNNMNKVVPTVILCPMLSRDLCPTLDKITNIMRICNNNGQQNMKPPILIVSDIVTDDTFADIVDMCGCRLIADYINPDKIEEDQKAGLCPTFENVNEWAGGADQVIASATETKFINPKIMYKKKDDGTYELDSDGNLIMSDVCKSKIVDIEATLDSLIRENGKESAITKVRRRLNVFKTNMVDLLIGGIITTDRDSAMHLADDAIRNCRSAAKDGYGYGANFEGLMAVKQIKAAMSEDDELFYVVDILDDAYTSLLTRLYATCMTDEEAAKEVLSSIERNMPINLSNNVYDGTVLSSIMTDQCILDSISKIVSIMFTANQAIVTNPLYNNY